MNYKLLWLVLSTTIIIACSIVSQAPVLVGTASLFGILFVVCVAFGKPAGNLFGAAFNLCLAWLSYEAGFYGNVGMALLITAMHFWGYWKWSISFDEEEGEIAKKDLSRKQQQWLFMGLISLSTIAVVTSFAAGSNLWFLDGITTFLPLIATMLLVGAYKATWYLFVPFNALQVVMWFFAYSAAPEVMAMLVMKCIFLFNSFIGYYEWNKKPKAVKKVEVVKIKEEEEVCAFTYDKQQVTKTPPSLSPSASATARKYNYNNYSAKKTYNTTPRRSSSTYSSNYHRPDDDSCDSSRGSSCCSSSSSSSYSSCSSSYSNDDYCGADHD